MQRSPLFQRRHYQAIAKVLAKGLDDDRDHIWLILTFSRMFAEDDLDYQPQKFYEACGVDPVTGQKL